MHRFLLLTIFASIAFLAQISGNEVLENGELIYTHVVYRHGDRTPFKPYPKDPYKDPSNWETGWGQLTNKGKRQQRDLGQWLRERYDDLLSETYSREEIHVRSTDVDRTIMSAQSNLAGLYPPKDGDVWDPFIAWQPIPVHTERSGAMAAKKCPAYIDMLEALHESSEYMEFDETYRLDYKYITRHSGKSIKNRSEAAAMYSILHIEEMNNKTLPEWTKKVYPEPLRTIAAQSFTTSTATREMARLRSGPLLKSIFDGFADKLNGSALRMKMDSGHDTTTSGLLNTLKLFEPHVPPFAACIMMELRMYEDHPYVTVIYKNETLPRILQIPGCGVACPFEKMKELYADVIPKDWHAECGGSNSEEFHAEALTSSGEEDNSGCTLAEYFNATFYLLVTSFLILLVLMVLIHGYLIERRRNLYGPI